MDTLLSILLAFATVFDPVVLIVLLKQICFKNIKTTTHVVTINTYKLVSPQYIEVEHRMTSLLPSAVKKVFKDIAWKLLVTYDYDINKYILFHVMTYITMVILYPQFDIETEQYFAFDKDYMTKAGFDAVRYIVASFYLKVFSNKNETIKTVYKYMDNNDITYSFLGNKNAKYSGFSFIDFYNKYIFLRDDEECNYYNNVLPIYNYIIINKRTKDEYNIVKQFNKTYDLSGFIKESLYDKEILPAFCLRSSFNEINEDKINEDLNSNEYLEFYEDNENYMEQKPKEDYHSKKIKRKRNTKNLKKENREGKQKVVTTSLPRRGGRRKCSIISQYSS